MATEKVVEREVPVERVVEREVPAARGGMGAGGVIAIILVIAALVIGGMFLMNMQNSEVAKDNAIAGAAASVADSAADAAGAVSDAVTPK